MFAKHGAPAVAHRSGAWLARPESCQLAPRHSISRQSIDRTEDRQGIRLASRYRDACPTAGMLAPNRPNPGIWRHKRGHVIRLLLFSAITASDRCVPRWISGSSLTLTAGAAVPGIPVELSRIGGVSWYPGLPITIDFPAYLFKPPLLLPGCLNDDLLRRTQSR